MHWLHLDTYTKMYIMYFINQSYHIHINMFLSLVKAFQWMYSQISKVGVRYLDIWCKQGCECVNIGISVKRGKEIFLQNWQGGSEIDQSEARFIIVRTREGPQ